jgi:hypothetical protein
MPEVGFHYSSSLESRDDNADNIAHLFRYCSESVAKWPSFRRHVLTVGLKSPRQCDDIEKNAIDVFRDVRDVIFEAIDTNNLPRLREPRLLQRLVLAHSYMALHADPASMGEYRNMVWSEMCQDSQAALPQTADFNKAVWESKWNEPANITPFEVTRRETGRHARVYLQDGLYDTNRVGANRRDPVARARESIDSLDRSMERINPLFLTSEPINAVYEERQLLDLFSELNSRASSTLMKKAFKRAAAKQLFLRAGLKPKQASFGVRVLYDGAKESDNPTAWKAIYRKRSQLMAEARKIFGLDWGKRFISPVTSGT